MHIIRDSSFFLINMIEAPHEEQLGLMNPLSNDSCFFNFYISIEVALYSSLEISVILDTNSILKSTSLLDASLVISFGNTS